MRLFCLILPMAGTDFLWVVSKKDKGFQNGVFLYNHIHFPKLARDSIPLPLVSSLTEVAR